MDGIQLTPDVFNLLMQTHSSSLPDFREAGVDAQHG
jgi:hypothetical protein